MATVAELREHIKKVYLNTNEMDDGQLMVSASTPTGIVQPVFVGFAEDHAWILAPFAKTADLSAAKALESDSAYGVVVFGDWYCYSSVAYIENIDASEVRWFIDKMAIEGQYRMGQLG